MEANPEHTSHTNKEFWNSQAATYNNRNDALEATIAKAIKDNASWIGIPDSGKVLDFACGTGMVSMAIAGRNPVLSLRGIDIADRMVAQYMKRFEAVGKIDAAAVAVDLMDSSAFKPGSPIQGSDWLNFDMAAVASALHHIDKPDIAIARLVERLKVDGVLCVIDWVDEGKYDHDHHRSHEAGGYHHPEAPDDQKSLLRKSGVVHRHGFSKDRILTLMQAAGLEELGFLELEQRLQFGPFDRKVFIARGRKSKPTRIGLSSATSWNLMH